MCSGKSQLLNPIDRKMTGPLCPQADMWSGHLCFVLSKTEDLTSLDLFAKFLFAARSDKVFLGQHNITHAVK